MPKIKPCQAEWHMPLIPAFVKQRMADPKFKANTTLPTVYLGTINKLKIWVLSSFIFVVVSLRQVSAFLSSVSLQHSSTRLTSTSWVLEKIFYSLSSTCHLFIHLKIATAEIQKLQTNPRYFNYLFSPSY